MRNKLLLIFCLLGVTFNVKAEDYTQFVADDIVKGDLAAPVTFIVYASATCGHCAHFEKDVIPRVIKDYVKKGKVAYAFRDFPLDPLAFAVAKVQRCAPEKSYYNFVSAFFNSQRQWIGAQNHLQAIKNIAKIGGMKSDKVEKCIANPELQKEIDKLKKSGMDLGINGTPAFLINGKVYEGFKNYSQVRNLIERELR